MHSNSLKIALGQLFGARLHLGQSKNKLNSNVICYVRGLRHGISILNLEAMLYNLRIVHAAMVEMAATRGVFFLFSGAHNLLVASLIHMFFSKYNSAKNKNHIYINAITTGTWVHGLFSNWPIVRAYIADLKKLKTKNIVQRASLINLQRVKYLYKKIIPDLALFFQGDAESIKEIKDCNVPVIGITDGLCNPKDFLYALLGNSENAESILFFCQFMEDAFRVGRLEEQEKFLYYFILKIKKNIINENVK